MSMAFECDMELSQEELIDAVEKPRVSGRSRRTVTLVAALFAACAAISLWQNPSVMAQVKGHLFIGLDDEAVAAAASDGCEDLPFVKLTDVVTSNLCKQGPDDDAEEGIIYKATAYHTGADVENLQIHVHCLADFGAEDGEDNYDKNYRPAFTHGKYVNGIFGLFGAINVPQNVSVKVRAHAYDADKKEDIALPHSAISFFDLDTGVNGTHSVEHVTLRKFKAYYLSNETEVKVSQSGDLTVFAASTEGTGADNPDDPTALTKQQKNRAVTVEFENTNVIDFEVGASAGKTGRVFSFVFRPSLLCAKTKLADGTLLPATGKSAPITPERGSARKELPSMVFTVAFLSAVVASFV